MAANSGILIARSSDDESDSPRKQRDNGDVGSDRYAEPTERDFQELMGLFEALEPFVSIGRVSSGIAHNLNGYLAGLIGHLELLRMKRSELGGDLDNVLDLAKKLRDGIAEFAGKLENELTREAQPQNINQILRSVMSFLRADLFFKHSIQVDLQLEEPLPNVFGAYADFSLPFENIIVNAVDGQREKKSGWLGVRTGVREDRVVIEIEDNGPGFSAEALAHALEPLWPGVRQDEDGRVRGGMSLALCKKRLERWGGGIQLGNRQDRGARVTITLPKREKTPRKRQ